MRAEGTFHDADTYRVYAAIAAEDAPASRFDIRSALGTNTIDIDAAIAGLRAASLVTETGRDDEPHHEHSRPGLARAFATFWSDLAGKHDVENETVLLLETQAGTDDIVHDDLARLLTTYVEHYARHHRSSTIHHMLVHDFGQQFEIASYSRDTPSWIDQLHRDLSPIIDTFDVNPHDLSRAIRHLEPFD